ncbi:hypothetical protein FM106_28860 [Brachybacterium faecium]|nr:hypothetical protein FM106_28860 [Brachybacterium faecium]
MLPLFFISSQIFIKTLDISRDVSLGYLSSPNIKLNIS